MIYWTCTREARGHAVAHRRINLSSGGATLDDLRVIWHGMSVACRPRQRVVVRVWRDRECLHEWEANRLFPPESVTFARQAAEALELSQST